MSQWDHVRCISLPVFDYVPSSKDGFKYINWALGEKKYRQHIISLVRP